MTCYSENDYLPLSDIQHYVFCKRQFALIAIEQSWVENFLTQDGRWLHENVHNGLAIESRGNHLQCRGLRVQSKRLGLYGVCDMVEFEKTDDANPRGVNLWGFKGHYIPSVVEYKRGKPKQGLEDIAQLVAQSMALEEMLNCSIDEAYFYYGATRHRLPVELTDELKNQIVRISVEMHKLVEKGYRPKAVYSHKCHACSLYELCLPDLDQHKTVDQYISEMTNLSD